MISLPTTPIDLFHSTLKTLGISTHGGFSNGRAAIAFMQAVSRIGADPESVRKPGEYIDSDPTQGSPRAIHHRWSSVFKIIHSVLHVDVQQSQRDAIFCADEDESLKLLMSVFLQVKDLAGFRLVVQSAEKEAAGTVQPPSAPLHACTCSHDHHPPRQLHPYTGVDVHEPALRPLKHVVSIGVGTTDGDRGAKIGAQAASLIRRLSNPQLLRLDSEKFESPVYREPTRSRTEMTGWRRAPAVAAKPPPVAYRSLPRIAPSNGLGSMQSMSPVAVYPRRSPPRRPPRQISLPKPLNASLVIPKIEDPAALERRERARKLLDAFRTPEQPSHVCSTESALELQPNAKSVSPSRTPRKRQGPEASKKPKAASPVHTSVEHTSTTTDPVPPSVPQIVALVQSHCRTAVSWRHRAHMTQRHPSARFIQLVWRHIVRERRRLVDPPPYEQFPVEPLSRCRRCIPILAALQSVVQCKNEAIKFASYSSMLCDECRPLATKVVQETRECNAHRHNPTSLSLICTIQASLRWHLSLFILDSQIHLHYLSFTHEVQRIPRQTEVLLFVQLRFLFNRWLKRMRKLRRSTHLPRDDDERDDDDRGTCRRCGPIVQSMLTRTLAAAFTPAMVDKYTSLMCESCADLTCEAMRQSNVRRCEYALYRVVATMTMAVNMLKHRRLRRWRSPYQFAAWLLTPVQCRRCVPLLQTMICRMVHRRRERQAHGYAKLMCHSCRRLALRGVMLANAAAASRMMFSIVTAKCAALKWIGRIACAEAVAHFGDSCFRDAPIFAALETRLHAMPDLPQSTITKYSSILCKDCASKVQRSCASAQDLLRGVVFVQLCFRWKLMARRLADRRLLELSTIETTCLRCGPLKDALHERLTRNPAIPQKILQRYVKMMCHDCETYCTTALGHFERRRVAAASIQSVFRFHLVMKRRVKRPVYGTKGQCRRCGPIVKSFQHALAHRAIAGINESAKAQHQAMAASYKRHAAAVCSRCRNTINAMFLSDFSQIASMPDVTVPALADLLPLHRIPHMFAAALLLSKDELHQRSSQLQAYARAKLSAKLRAAVSLRLITRAVGRPLRVLQYVFRFRHRSNSRGTKTGKYPWDCQRCSPIIDAMCEHLKGLLCGTQHERQRYLSLLCAACCQRLDLMETEEKNPPGPSISEQLFHLA